MRVTITELKKLNACDEGLKWFRTQRNKEIKSILRTLVKEDHFTWANWYVTKLFTHPQAVLYAIFSAEMVLENYEKKYLGDTGPRKAIEAAKTWVINPNDKNKCAAYAAANAAYTAYAASYASYAAANAAYAANAASYASYAAYDVCTKIIEKAIELLGI